VASDIPLLTVPQAARLLAVHPNTLRRAIWLGAIDAVRIGRAIRLRYADVMAAGSEGLDLGGNRKTPQ
jgi:excisionase family DNA binding protein